MVSSSRAAAGALALIAGLSPPPQESATARDAPAERAAAAPAAQPRAGAERCADCHEPIVEAWRATAMARALGPIARGELDRLETVAEPESGFRYRFESEDDRHLLVETAAGKPDFVRRVPLVFAIGAGVQDRAYVATVGTYLWSAPLEVLTAEGARRAQLAPMHAMFPGSRFRLPITEECLGCHTEALPPPTFPLHLAPDASAWRPRGLSCAACHGDGEAHARWREDEENAAGSDPMPKLGELRRHERMSVCAACHLQGDARIVLHGARSGPPPPGGDLLDGRAVFVASEVGDEVGFVSQVERLVLSRCFTESPELDCTTCHDPHRDASTPRERRRIRARCEECHAGDDGRPADRPARACSRPPSAAAPDRDCVDCHMPRTGVFDVEAVEVHDHFIRCRPSERESAEGLRRLAAPDGAWRRFAWPDEPAPEHSGDPGLLLMARYSNGFSELALELLDAEPGAASRALPDYHHASGALLEEEGRLAEAERAYRTALELDPGYGPSGVNLGAVLARLHRPKEALAVLDEHLARHPASNGGLRNRALVRLDLGDVPGLVEDLESALELYPTAAQARTLADLWGQLGDPDRARAFLARAEALAAGREP